MKEFFFILAIALLHLSACAQQSSSSPKAPASPHPESSQILGESPEGITQEFQAHGIKVHAEIFSNEPERQAIFWKVLAQEKSYFFAKASKIAEIEATANGMYLTKEKTLWIPVAFGQEALAKYLSLFKRRLALEETTSVSFYLLPEAYSHRQDQDLDWLDNWISYLESQASNLKMLSPILHTMYPKSDQPSYIFELEHLDMTPDNYRAEFESFLNRLSPNLPFILFLRRHGVRLDAGGNVFAPSIRPYLDAIEFLSVFHTELALLADHGKLNYLEINTKGDWHSKMAGSMSIAYSPEAKATIAPVIRARARCVTLSEELGITFDDLYLDILDQGYLAMMAKVEARLDVIRRKLPHVRVIELHKGVAWYSNGHLYPGTEGTLEDFDKVLRQIPL